MRRLSLRGWQVLVSALLSLLVVGGIALTTYVIVSDGMQAVAYETSDRIANASAAVVREAVLNSELAAAELGATGQKAADVALADLRRRLPERLNGADLSGTRIALYSDASEPYWLSGPGALRPHDAADRLRAIRTGRLVRSLADRVGLATGLVRDANLGLVVSHIPVTLPGGDTGVLDVIYTPVAEERVIDAIRLPMAVLAVASTLIMVVLMQTSLVWVLALVDNLRRAADSIDTGRLDERLPESGYNEIGELARAINRLIERLQRRAEAQSRFVADASHELATPVAGIRGYTSILRAWGADDPKVREEAVDAIDRESSRMARLASELLNLLHADQGLRLRRERFDLNAVVRERLAATASIYLERGTEFIGPEADTLVMVGDPGRMEDVISILLDNAGKYTPPGGTVRVTTRRQRDEVTILVSDTGKGVPAEDLPRLFDRFFRSEKTRVEGEGGFGLGLAIAKSIVENMGGRIWAESEVGAGTTFTVVVPRGRM